MACARTVAVVVPSPAMSLVLLATSRTICAPIFSNLSASSISLATETPSLVTRGAPKLFSRRTLRPLGPRVTFTASASLLMPSRSFCCAWASKTICFAAMLFYSSVDHREDIVLAKDEIFRATDLNLGATVFAEEDLIALLHIEGRHRSVFADAAIFDRLDHTLDGLLFGGIGDDDPTFRLELFFQTFDEHSIVQRTNLHRYLPRCSQRPPSIWTDVRRGEFIMHRETRRRSPFKQR